MLSVRSCAKGLYGTSKPPCLYLFSNYINIDLYVLFFIHCRSYYLNKMGLKMRFKAR